LAALVTYCGIAWLVELVSMAFSFGESILERMTPAERQRLPPQLSFSQMEAQTRCRVVQAVSC
jgi:hypothetical protein